MVMMSVCDEVAYLTLRSRRPVSSSVQQSSIYSLIISTWLLTFLFNVNNSSRQMQLSSSHSVGKWLMLECVEKLLLFGG